MNNKIRFAIIGFGHIGRRHATIVNEYPNAELAAIVDLDSKAKSHDLYPDGIPFFDSLSKLLNSDVKCDVVNIATPNGIHAELALEALEARKHVVIEKPMGLSKANCEDVVFKALQVSKQVFVVKQNRYSPPSKWLEEVVGKGTVGKIQTVQVNCFWNRDDRYYKPGGWKGTLDLDGGTLFTQFSHFIDIMYWVFGDIKNIKASFSDFTHQNNTEFERAFEINPKDILDPNNPPPAGQEIKYSLKKTARTPNVDLGCRCIMKEGLSQDDAQEDTGEIVWRAGLQDDDLVLSFYPRSEYMQFKVYAAGKTEDQWSKKGEPVYLELYREVKNLPMICPSIGLTGKMTPHIHTSILL